MAEKEFTHKHTGIPQAGKYFGNPGGKKPGHQGSVPNMSMPEKTASFGGLPGKTQSSDRSTGVRRLKTRAQTNGL
jgi:hypothetical protein